MRGSCFSAFCSLFCTLGAQRLMPKAHVTLLQRVFAFFLIFFSAFFLEIKLVLRLGTKFLHFVMSSETF